MDESIWLEHRPTWVAALDESNQEALRLLFELAYTVGMRDGMRAEHERYLHTMNTVNSVMDKVFGVR